MTKRLIALRSLALTILPLLAAGAALAQTTEVSEDEDWLTPQERILGHHPNLHPDWTWMSEDKAILLLKAAGFSDVLSLERFGAFWRGKAMANGAFYHVAINRYGDVFGHIDGKSLIAAREKERNERTKPVENMLATLNGPIVAPSSQAAPTVVTPHHPVATVMGETAWTWLSEEQVIAILKSNGYTHVRNMKRDAEGLWRAKAVNGNLETVRVAVDVFSNIEIQPEYTGGVAQADPTD